MKRSFISKFFNRNVVQNNSVGVERPSYKQIVKKRVMMMEMLHVIAGTIYKNNSFSCPIRIAKYEHIKNGEYEIIKTDKFSFIKKFAVKTECETETLLIAGVRYSIPNKIEKSKTYKLFVVENKIGGDTYSFSKESAAAEYMRQMFKEVNNG